ncbi:MAG: hypothetical protein JWN87_3375 [Frankiales bacterium]|nr:hypothetical protein [Frankiales bacterium]
MQRTIVAAALGAAFLTLFFRSVRLRWPENYSTLRGALESYVSQGLSRYLAFRTLPVFAVGVFVNVSCRRLSAHPVAAVVLLGVLHLAVTNGRATVSLLRRRGSGENRANMLFFYGMSSILVTAACEAAILAGPHLNSVVPRPGDLATAAWTGLFAAVLAVSLQSLGRKDVSDETLLERARRDVGDRLWHLTADAAVWHQTDPSLLQAIVAAEALQRPRALRRLERWRGKVLPAGTYGVAQMSAATPISDEESLARLAQSFSGYIPEHDQYGSVHAERLAFRLEQHNRKRAFLSMVASFYSELVPSWSGTTAVSLDQRPVIQVAPAEREGGSWVLHGSASVFEGTMCWSAVGEGYEDAGVLQVHPGAPARGAFTLTLPVAATRVTFSEPPMEEDDALAEDRTYTLTL